MNAGDIPPWLEGPADFGEPDPATPLFDSLYAVLCMGDPDPHRYTGTDGAVYLRADPDEFEDGDHGD